MISKNLHQDEGLTYEFRPYTTTWWTENKRKIIAMAAVLSLFGGVMYHREKVNEAYKRGYSSGQTYGCMSHVFNERHGVEGLISDSADSRQQEMRNAFIHGIVKDNPYHTTREELADLVKEGLEVRQESMKRYSP